MSLKDVFIIINQVLKAQKASHQNYRYMWKIIDVIMGLLDGASPGGASGKEPACQCRNLRNMGLIPWVEKGSKSISLLCL